MYFENIPVIPYEGPNSTNPLAFKFYDANKIVAGKPMKEHLPFAMAWWHNLCAGGTDMFGRDTADKSFGAEKGTMEHAKAKVDAGFEFMQKLGIEYFCFHDVDIVPEADDIKETNRRLDEISDYILEKMKETGIKCLWGTANMFSNPRFMNGAGSTNSADVFCFAAAQVKKALDITVKLGGRGYVFWGGREGYETLLNTDVKFEQENIAALMKMAVKYGRSIGFEGDFYIEPKPKEPMKHQYDFDAATAIGFLRQYGLDKDFKMNIEANHATLAGHTFQHDLRISAINGMSHVKDLSSCDMPPIPEDAVIQAFLRLYDNLKHGEILQFIQKTLSTIRSRKMLWSTDIVELNQRISDISSQSHKLSTLNRRGMVDPDIFISKSNQLAEQLRNAKQQKERILQQEDRSILDSTEQLLETIEAGPEVLEAFDEELFCELIDKIIVESNVKIRFRLKNGLELPETIERTMR